MDIDVREKAARANWRIIKKVMRRYYTEAGQVTPQQLEASMTSLLGMEIFPESIARNSFKIEAIMVCDCDKYYVVHLFGRVIRWENKLEGVTMGDFCSRGRKRFLQIDQGLIIKWLTTTWPYTLLKVMTPEMAALLLAQELEKT